jgi:hypothetical protein
MPPPKVFVSHRFTLACDAEDRLRSLTYNGIQELVERDYTAGGRRVRIRLMKVA